MSNPKAQGLKLPPETPREVLRMSLVPEEILGLIHTIWQQVLDLEIHEATNANAPLTATDSLMTSCVQITGDWEGAIAVYCSTDFAKQAAAIAFAMEDSEIQLEEMQDILGELTNILGGNIKSLVPGSCQLSLPSVIEGRDYRFGVLGSQISLQFRLTCLNEAIHIAMFEKAPKAGRHVHPPQPQDPNLKQS